MYIIFYFFIFYLFLKMSTNTTFGTNNNIDPIVTNSLAAGEGNEIIRGNGQVCLGAFNRIESFDSDSCIGAGNLIDTGNIDPRFNGIGNQCVGFQNIMASPDDEYTIVQTGNSLRGIKNQGSDNQTSNVNGSFNRLFKSYNGCIQGNANEMNSTFASYINGVGNLVKGTNTNDPEKLILSTSGMAINGFQNKIIFETDTRKGVNLSGRQGYALFDKSKKYAEDTYNYSNQLAGGGGPLSSDFLGEGISMIDRTIVNGVYPLGKHQAYQNTSDGTNYSIMMKSDRVLKVGTFVSLSTKCDCGCNDSYEKILVAAKRNCDVIGVITESSGFIANAGQFAASERIEYDKFDKPIIKLNIATSSEKSQTNNLYSCIKASDEILPIYQSLEEPPNNQIEENNFKVGELLDPAFLTVIKSDIDRSVPFIPFNERPNYYQVAVSGLVVVRAKFSKQDLFCSNKCDVKRGKAVPGDKYWIVKIIDEKHLQILIK